MFLGKYVFSNMPDIRETDLTLKTNSLSAPNFALWRIAFLKTSNFVEDESSLLSTRNRFLLHLVRKLAKKKYTNISQIFHLGPEMEVNEIQCSL